jgi:cathepsin F
VLAQAAKEYDLTKTTTALFKEYLSDYGITFLTESHQSNKFQVFSANVELIKKLNKANPGTKFGLNKFALLSQEEFKAKYLSPFKPIRPNNAPVLETRNVDIPDTFDWRDSKPPVVTAVKDQGGCGSCWAFSTVANIEGQWAKAGHTLTSLSEQNLVDCDHHCMEYENEQACDAGCNGGLPPNAYAYVIENKGIDTEDSYSYDGYDKTCRYKSSTVGATLKNWTFVSQDEDQMAAVLVSQGPLSVAVEADMWQFYIGGVFYLPCGTSLDHAVLLVGYGTETDVFFRKMPFWTVKNSWGDDWGSSGYIFVERGDGRCGINLYVSTGLV